MSSLGLCLAAGYIGYEQYRLNWLFSRIASLSRKLHELRENSYEILFNKLNGID